MYIISSSLVEQRFTGKQSDYTVFGHVPSSTNKMFFLWKFLFRNQLKAHPNLLKSNASLIYQNDFNYIKDFSWSFKLWDKYLNPISEISADKNEAYYEIN